MEEPTKDESEDPNLLDLPASSSQLFNAKDSSNSQAERRSYLFEELSLLNLTAANCYLGAIKVLETHAANPDAIPQAAHSLRELTALLNLNRGSKRPDSIKDNIERLEQMLDSQNLD